MSYAVNSGRWDNAAGNTAYPFDWKENGIFFDQFLTSQQNTLHPTSPWPQTQIDLGYISKHDGTSNTILLGENQDATQWQIVGGAAPAQDLVSLVWQDLTSVTPGLNQNAGSNYVAPGSGTATLNTARPSSIHPGGYLLTFCDGHVQFMSNDMQYQVYALLMTPNGPQTRAPGVTTYSTTSPTQYSSNVPVVITQAMLNP
jgi:prepilin-type processing-associated H-X9-DG protein